MSSEPHATLGQQLILVLQASGGEEPGDLDRAIATLDTLERPKKVYTFTQLPLTETGKVKRAQIKEVLEKQKK